MTSDTLQPSELWNSSGLLDLCRHFFPSSVFSQENQQVARECWVSTVDHLAVTCRDRINIRWTESDLPRSWYVWHDLESGEGSYEPKRGKCDIQTSLDVFMIFPIIKSNSPWCPLKGKTSTELGNKSTTNCTQGGKFINLWGFRKTPRVLNPASSTASQPSNQPFPFFTCCALNEPPWGSGLGSTTATLLLTSKIDFYRWQLEAKNDT